MRPIRLRARTEPVRAALATQIIKSDGLGENPAKAQGCSARLEILEPGMAAGQIDFKAGLEEFARCAESAAFLQEV